MSQPSAPVSILDVSQLPTSAFGTRAPLWWGVLLLAAIEETMFVLLGLCYFYVRGQYTHFPPTDLGAAARWLATADGACLLLSVPPTILAARAARQQRTRAVRWYLVVATLLSCAAMVLRALVWQNLHFRWDLHAYGSVVWLTLGLHFVEVMAGTLENLLLITVLFKGPVEESHFVDVEVSALFWYFVVATWLILQPILFFDPVLFAK